MFGCSYIKQALGAPTPAEFESVKAENHGLKRQLEDAQQRIAELEGKVRTQGVAESIRVGLQLLQHCKLLLMPVAADRA
eukprot:scaffold51164_cov19-Tisochrysis_lutea.AAC.5